MGTNTNAKPRVTGRQLQPPTAPQRAERISISLTGRAASTTRQLSESLHLSEGDVVRRALSLLAAVTAEEAEGAALMLRSPDGELERIRFLSSV